VALALSLPAGPERETVVALTYGVVVFSIFVQGLSIGYVTRTGGVWSSPSYLLNCLTNDRVALAPLPNGGAIVAFRGQDKYLYWLVYSGGTWSAVAPFATPTNVSADGSPAVTHGIGGVVAEMAYVTGGTVYHARLTGSTWSAPVTVGGASVAGVAIASAP